MAEPTAIDGVVQGGLLAPPSGSHSPPIFCFHCAADVTALPPVARFCNRCGSDLPKWFHGKPMPSLPIPDPPIPTNPPAELPPPLILLAYARAMFNLGCRYETAVGSQRNMQEATRCYWKAARLGDAAARERYDAHAMASPALAYHPAALAAGTLPVRDPSPPFATVYRPGVS